MEDNGKPETIEITVTRDEHRRLQHAAEAAGADLNAYILRALERDLSQDDFATPLQAPTRKTKGNTPLHEPVRDWYLSAYPCDPAGGSLVPGVTFSGLLQRLATGANLMEAAGLIDGAARERVFNRIAELTGHPVSDVYNLWATCGHVNAFAGILEGGE